jgi:hypothetical protein
MSWPRCGLSNYLPDLYASRMKKSFKPPGLVALEWMMFGLSALIAAVFIRMALDAF